MRGTVGAAGETREGNGPRGRAGEGIAAALPPRASWQVVFAAQSPQALPPMPASALRGALLRGLLSISCTETSRESCAGCPAASRCAYPALVSGEDGARGRSFDAPPLMVLRCEAPYTGEPLRLQPGDEVRFRVTLAGPAMDHASLVGAALRDAARRGIGMSPERPGPRRPVLELAEIREASLARPSLATTVNLRFTSPARLHRDGRAAPALDPDLLWGAMVRRARTLAAACGNELPELPRETPFTFGTSASAPVRVTRWSERQGRRMSWDALAAEAELRVHADGEAVGALLAFAQDVQLGKGTQFGFGALRCAAHGEPRA